MSKNFLALISFSLFTNLYAAEISINQIENQTKTNPLFCHLSDHCQNNNENPSWAKFQMASDLGEIEVKNFVNEITEPNITKYLANVAVIDSGFDSEQQLNGLQVYPRLIKGYDLAGVQYIDQNGHGTAVSGMIAARETGVTKNINLDIFRLTGNNAAGSASHAMIADSILRACQTSEIVNLSWGGYADEQGAESPANAIWYQEAMDKGCLIIKSAGNSGFKSYTNYDLPIEAPIILVAATNSAGENSSFSSQGDIFAPGEKVYTLHSLFDTKIEDYEKDEFCKVKNNWMKKINGTSFASPAVAAILGQVLTILKIKNIVPEDPYEKIAILKKIVFASAKWSVQSGDRLFAINSYLSTLIAKHLQYDELDSTIDELIEIGKREIKTKGICDESFISCSNISTCDDQKACTHIKRKKMYLCDNLRAEATIDLLESFTLMQETEMISYITSRVSKEIVSENILQSLFEKSWNKNFEVNNKNEIFLKNPEGALNTLEFAIEKNFSKFVTAQKLATIINESIYLQAFQAISSELFNPVHQEIIEKQKKLWEKNKVIPLEEAKKQQLKNIFLSLSLDEKIKFLSLFPKKKDSYTEKFNAKNIAFLEILIGGVELLKENEKLIITENLNKIITDMLNEIKNGNEVAIYPDALNSILKIRKNFLDELKLNIPTNLLKSPAAILNIILRNSDKILNQEKEYVISGLLDEILTQINHAQKINYLSEFYPRMKKNIQLKDLNNKIKIIFQLIFKLKIEFKEEIFEKIKKIHLSNIPMDTGHTPLDIKGNYKSVYSKKLFNDSNFMKKYIERLFFIGNKFYNFEMNVNSSYIENMSILFEDNLSELKYSFNLLNHILEFEVNENLINAFRGMVNIYEISRTYKDYKIIEKDIVPNWFARKFLKKKIIPATPIKIQMMVNESKYFNIYTDKSIIAILKFVAKTRGLTFTQEQKSHFNESIEILKNELKNPDSPIRTYQKIGIEEALKDL